MSITSRYHKTWYIALHALNFVRSISHGTDMTDGSISKRKGNPNRSGDKIVEGNETEEVEACLAFASCMGHVLGDHTAVCARFLGRLDQVHWLADGTRRARSGPTRRRYFGKAGATFCPLWRINTAFVTIRRTSTWSSSVTRRPDRRDWSRHYDQKIYQTRNLPCLTIAH
jgi:hypothetical protein